MEVTFPTRAKSRFLPQVNAIANKHGWAVHSAEDTPGLLTVVGIRGPANTADRLDAEIESTLDGAYVDLMQSMAGHPGVGGEGNAIDDLPTDLQDV